MRILKLFSLFMVCVACISSCASVAGASSGASSKKDTLYVNITDSSKFVLLPTEGIERAMDMAQFLSAKFREKNYFLNAWVKADENAIEMTLFNELGANMGELSYRSGAVHFISAVIPNAVLKSLKMEYVIADFQLCFYDPILLEKSLKDGGLVLETRDGSRRISSGNDIIIEIKKTGNVVELVNHLKGYSYTLEGDFHGFQ